MISPIRVFIAAAMLSLLTACATPPRTLQAYDGAPRPDEEIAILICGQGVSAIIDDRYRLENKSTNRSGCEIRLPAGVHTFSISYAWRNGMRYAQYSTSAVELVHRLEAGHRYKLSTVFNEQGTRWTALITDERGGGERR